MIIEKMDIRNGMNRIENGTSEENTVKLMNVSSKENSPSMVGG